MSDYEHIPEHSIWLSRVRTPVYRGRTEFYLLILLISFGVSVAGTRLFLELTGYPQLGGAGLHIAHVLWGGLLLFAACLIMLIYANRWSLVAGAIVAGAGMGLFIDEVGKFITDTNDYFIPAAAPIIYVFFLLTVVVYMQVRRRRLRNPRNELYQALESMQELLDHDLETNELAILRRRLKYVISESVDPSQAELARSILVYLDSEHVMVVPERGQGLHRWAIRIDRTRKEVFTETRLRISLIAGNLLLVFFSTATMLRWSLSLYSVQQLQVLVLDLIQTHPVDSMGDVRVFLVQAGLQAGVGLLLFLAAVCYLLKKARIATSLATFGLMFALSVVNILVFYFEQFSTIFLALLQLVLLLGVLDYRTRFVAPEMPRELQPAEPPEGRT